MVPKGMCHLCGELKGLTYEHVPARSSYNHEPAELFGLESWLRQAPSGEMAGGVVLEAGGRRVHPLLHLQFGNQR